VAGQSQSATGQDSCENCTAGFYSSSDGEGKPFASSFNPSSIDPEEMIVRSSILYLNHTHKVPLPTFFVFLLFF